MEVDLSMRKRDDNFGMTFTGFLQVTREAEYPFAWKAHKGSTLTIAGKVMGKDERGWQSEAKVFLTAGAHEVSLTYRRHFEFHSPLTLTPTLPSTVVPGSEVVATRIEAAPCWPRASAKRPISTSWRPMACGYLSSTIRPTAARPGQVCSPAYILIRPG